MTKPYLGSCFKDIVYECQLRMAKIESLLLSTMQQQLCNSDKAYFRTFDKAYLQGVVTHDLY